MCMYSLYTFGYKYIYAFNKSLYGVNLMAYFNLKFYANTISEPGLTWFTYCTYNI